MKIFLTSEILGMFSMIQGPSARITAGRIATAAFFAPLIRTVPFKAVPPEITNFSTKAPPFKKYLLVV
jgi:hypothetical protein